MTATQTTVTNDPAAHKILRAAHEGGYRFPTGFAGFAADLTYADDTQSVNGSVTLRSPRQIELNLPDTTDDVREWVTRELASMAGHRWPRSYEEGDGRWTLTLAGEDHGGALIQLHDDPFGSFYRVRDGHIIQVTRNTSPLRFSILVLSHTTAPDGRALPATFVVSYWQSSPNRLIRTEAYVDDFTEVDGVMLPSRREVTTSDDQGVTRRELVLRSHRLFS